MNALRMLLSSRNFFFCAVLITAASAQNDPAQGTAGDRSLLLRNIGAELHLPSPAFRLPLTFVLSAPPSSPTLPLYRSFTDVPRSFAWEQQNAPDLTGPLKLQLQESGGEKAFHFTLSAASTGGALFLAYKYLKRNGLR